MKLGIVVMATLLAVGFVAVDGVAENLGGEGIVTQNAAASCVDVGDECVWVCVESPVRSVRWECTM